MGKKSKKGATRAKAGAEAPYATSTASADGPAGDVMTTSGAAGRTNAATRHYHRTPLVHAIPVIMVIISLPATALAARRLSPSRILVRAGVGSADDDAQEARSTNIPVGTSSGSRRARRNQEVNILDLLGGGSGGSGAMEGGDGINLIMDGLYQNNVDVDVDVVGIINQCLVAGNGNMDINCFIGKLDDQIPDFNVKEMAEQMGVGTEPYVPPPVLDCPSDETEVKSFQIPATGEYCAVCIPFHARTICGFSCSCSNGDCGCSLKPPDCPGTLICAGTDGHGQEALPSEPEIWDNVANADGGADATVNEIPEDNVALEGDGSNPSEMPGTGNSSTAFFEEKDSSEAGKNVAIHQEPASIVDYNVTSTYTEEDLAVLLEDAANETNNESAPPDLGATVPSSQSPRNDENSSSARKHTGLGLFSLLVRLIVIPAASAILLLC